MDFLKKMDQVLKMFKTKIIIFLDKYSTPTQLVTARNQRQSNSTKFFPLFRSVSPIVQCCVFGKRYGKLTIVSYNDYTFRWE